MSSRLARSAGLIGVATMASRLLGVARESVMASLFGAGAGPEMDAFNVAFRVPNLLRDLFAEGALSTSFVPTYVKTLRREGRAAAYVLANRVVTTLTLYLGVIALAAMIFPGPVVRATVGKATGLVQFDPLTLSVE